MGRIGIVKSITRAERRGAKVTDVKVDTGGGNVTVNELFSTPGVDAPPLPGDYAEVVPTQRTGVYVVVGALDPNAQQDSEPGEFRAYGRDTSGAQVNEVHLAGDGSVTLSNGSGTIELASDGTVTINGVTIDPAGIITLPDSSVLNQHLHAAGALLDAEGRPVTGATAPLV